MAILAAVLFLRMCVLLGSSTRVSSFYTCQIKYQSIQLILISVQVTFLQHVYDFSDQTIAFYVFADTFARGIVCLQPVPLYSFISSLQPSVCW